MDGSKSYTAASDSSTRSNTKKKVNNQNPPKNQETPRNTKKHQDTPRNTKRKTMFYLFNVISIKCAAFMGEVVWTNEVLQSMKKGN